MSSILSLPLCGIIPPMITPLISDDQLDVPGLESLVPHILSGGVHGLFILGTTGEAPSLSYQIRYELIERVCRLVNGRVPVLVGITDTCLRESIKIAQKAADSGASGLVLAPPYYFPAGQPELWEYLSHILPLLPLPVFLYNMPSMTKMYFELETISTIMEIPGIIGFKDSSANMIYFHKLLRLVKNKPEFSLFIGPEELLGEAVLFGCHGGVCGGANMFPRLYVDLYHAARQSNLDTVLSCHKKILDVSTTLYNVGKYSSSIIKGIKCTLNLMGICSDYMAEPFHRFRETQRQDIKKMLTELKVEYSI